MRVATLTAILVGAFAASDAGAAQPVIVCKSLGRESPRTCLMMVAKTRVAKTLTVRLGTPFVWRNVDFLTCRNPDSTARMDCDYAASPATGAGASGHVTVTFKPVKGGGFLVLDTTVG